MFGTTALKYFVFLLIIVSITNSCESDSKREERLAKKYCGSCHLFPDPSLLDKETWQNDVLPEMRFRMGLDRSGLSKIPYEDLKTAIASLPQQPMISESDWKEILNYYSKNSPDTLKSNEVAVSEDLKQFSAEEIHFPNSLLPQVTLLKFDSSADKLYVGDRYSRIFLMSGKLIGKDSFKLPSPPSDILFEKPPVILLMGLMDPNDQKKGRLSTLDKQPQTIIDSLKRPVNVVKSDLNNDGSPDYIISEFGNFTGALTILESVNGKIKRHPLQFLPGARKVIVKDANDDGLPDIYALMTQGDEKIILFINKNNFNFDRHELLRFPPVYGSSYFALADFNGDGLDDILFTNGDNADFSKKLKPYHGVRIFLNKKNFEFKEHWFYHMPGAFQAEARDFDNDGDLDIAAISFFPDYAKNPKHGFLYFKNDGGKFTPYSTSLSLSGRWITMEVADIDFDKDDDIILGALDFNSQVPADIYNSWKAKNISLLILRNNQILKSEGLRNK